MVIVEAQRKEMEDVAHLWGSQNGGQGARRLSLLEVSQLDACREIVNLIRRRSHLSFLLLMYVSLILENINESEEKEKKNVPRNVTVRAQDSRNSF